MRALMADASRHPLADYLWVTRGIPRDLVLKLRDALAALVFVETGTYLGATTRWAAEHFAEVTSIEASPALHRNAVEVGKGQANVRYELGDSAMVLPRVVAALPGPAVFWLDGHYSGGATAGIECECPLMAELRAIATSPHAHAVLIDDARFFLSTPMPPHRRDHWPPIIEVLDGLRACAGDPHVVIIADVIVAVPQAQRRLLEDWCAALNGEAWQLYRDRQPTRSLWRRLAARLSRH